MLKQNKTSVDTYLISEVFASLVHYIFAPTCKGFKEFETHPFQNLDNTNKLCLEELCFVVNFWAQIEVLNIFSAFPFYMEPQQEQSLNDPASKNSYTSL